MKSRTLTLLFVSFLLAACGSADVDGGGTPAAKMTHKELADAHCDAFSKGEVPQVNGTAEPSEILTADNTLKELMMGAVVEPGGWIGEATLHVEEAGRYAFVAYEDPPTDTAGLGSFGALAGGPEAADYQECIGCYTACEALSVGGSYDLAAGDYAFSIRNDSYSSVRFAIAPIAAP
jgi:hypothetical protein